MQKYIGIAVGLASLLLMLQQVDAADDAVPLSPATKRELETVIKKAAKLAPPKEDYSGKKEHLTVDRSSSDDDSFENPPKGVVTSKSLGESIEVDNNLQDPTVDNLVEQAYSALSNGQQEVATSLYKRVLVRDKHNKSALFGLASIYQQQGQNSQARSLYATLLAHDAGNQAALNNFLMVVADESPEGALIEMKKLEAISPDFSPLPAQIAMIYNKLGKPQKAIRSLGRALAMSPENQTYRYNLAILCDKAGQRERAIALYKQLIDANSNGADLPGSVEQIKDRVLELNNEKSE